MEDFTSFFGIFYLIFDTECNLNCKYCYAEGSVEEGFKRQISNEKNLEKTFDFIECTILEGMKSGKLSDKLDFIFYGSEPLMHPSLFEYSLQRIKGISKKFKIPCEKQLISNLTLLNKSLAELIKKEEVEVVISLDGQKEIHDQMRVFHNKKGSFEKVLKGINILDNLEIPFSVSCTIGPHNFLVLNKSIDFFKKIKAKAIGFNLLLDAKFKRLPLVSNFLANKALFDSFEYAKNKGFLESRIGRKLKVFNSPGKIHLRDCGAYGNQLVFFPDGDIGICQGYLGCRKNILGNVLSATPKKVLNSGIIKNWILSSPLNRGECSSCPAIGICGGGCLFSNEINNGKIKSRNKSFCMHTLLSLDWFIKKSLERKLNDENLYIRDISFVYNNRLI
ncbi:MAG: radical SAM protein [Nanoarchaeota archaeon]